MFEGERVKKRKCKVSEEGIRKRRKKFQEVKAGEKGLREDRLGSERSGVDRKREQ